MIKKMKTEGIKYLHKYYSINIFSSKYFIFLKKRLGDTNMIYAGCESVGFLLSV